MLNAYTCIYIRFNQTLDEKSYISAKMNIRIVYAASRSRRKSRFHLPPAGHVRTIFPTRYPHPVFSELEKMVSAWRSVVAVSVNVGGGVRLIKTEKDVHTVKKTRRLYGRITSNQLPVHIP